MNALARCKNCGGDEGVHHYKTMACPVGGREAPVGKKQEYKTTTFEVAIAAPQNVEDIIKKYLIDKLDISIRREGYNDELISVSILFDGDEIASDRLEVHR